MTELYKSINSSSAKHKIIHQLTYCEKHFTSFNTILSGYLDKDTDVLMETNAPRTWFLFTVPFVATVVRHHLYIHDVLNFFTIINPPPSAFGTSTHFRYPISQEIHFYLRRSKSSIPVFNLPSSKVQKMPKILQNSHS